MRTQSIIFALWLLFIALLVPTSSALADYGDLSIMSVSFEPAQPVLGYLTKIIVKGQYTGSLPLTVNLGVDNIAFSHVDFYQENSPDYGSSIEPSVASPLVSGSTFNFTFVGRFHSAGEKNLVFKVDGVNNLMESNESNNTFSRKVNVLAKEDLIKLPNDPAIYKIEADGRKHLFVNSPTFWSHYTGSWANLKINGQTVFIQQLSQEQFDSIDIGNNVNIKSGSRLIKFQNSSRVYMVFATNKLKSITDVRAAAIYGSSWKNKLVTIQNGFESNYIQASQDFIDSDDDGLANEDETNIYHSDPYDADSDNDGYGDGAEVTSGYSPI